MPDFTHLQWQSIMKALEAEKAPFEIVRGVVKKRDAANMLVWTEELGDQPIPIASFDYEITYYDDSSKGEITPATGVAIPTHVKKRVTNIKRREVRTLCPKVGEFVLVIKQQGSRRLPVCLGVIRSTNFVV